MPPSEFDSQSFADALDGDLSDEETARLKAEWQTPVAPADLDVVGAPTFVPESDGDFLDTATDAQIADELVVDTKTGRLRQAGTLGGDDATWVPKLKARAETSLFTFARLVMGRSYLTTTLHRGVCQWLTALRHADGTPSRRKGLLLPREHAKTSIVSHCLPLHILIQPVGSNLYFPGEDGAEQRVLLACETLDRAQKHLAVQRLAWESNQYIRGLWPERCWPNPRRDAPRWNVNEYEIPRTGAWPEASVQAIGVGGAITGAHPSVVIKDDLISIEAANSDVVMRTAIDWHIASRALTNKASALEFIIGTRWAVFDLYSYIQAEDPSVVWITRSILEDGEPIYPEAGFDAAKIEQLRSEFKAMFFLLYMNSAADPSLVDFDMAMLRQFSLAGRTMHLIEDGRDVELLRRLSGPDHDTRPAVSTQALRGQDARTVLGGRDERRSANLAARHLRLTIG